MGTDRAKNQRNAAFPRPRSGRRPWERVARFPFPSLQTIETSLRCTTCFPAVTPFATVSGPPSRIPFRPRCA